MGADRAFRRDDEARLEAEEDRVMPCEYFTDIVTGKEKVTMDASIFDGLRDDLARSDRRTYDLQRALLDLYDTVDFYAGDDRDLRYALQKAYAVLYPHPPSVGGDPKDYPMPDKQTGLLQVMRARRERRIGTISEETWKKVEDLYISRFGGSAP